jgi:parvulin-like peptidyl-prolyl isomerase
MNQQDADLELFSSPAADGARSASRGDSEPSLTPTGASPRRWRLRLPGIVAAIAVVVACIAIKLIAGRSEADAQNSSAARGTKVKATRDANVRGASGQTKPKTQPTAEQQLNVVAVVNGEEIGRQELARECISVYGKEVLESLMNKQLILRYCQETGVQVTEQDVQEEINRMASRFGLATDQYLKMLKQERGITPSAYAGDIIWPMLALRRLAGQKIKPTAQEIEQAFQSQYGEAVKARIIVLEDAKAARAIQAQAAANSDDFGALAKQHSKDPSASMNGIIQPIRRFVGTPEIEKAAFSLREGEVSPVIPLTLGGGDQQLTQYVIIKCEGRMPEMKVNREQAEGRLTELIVEKKLRTAAAEIFEQLQERAKGQIVNVYNDPQLSRQMPGVAATIYDRRITMRELGEECISRHGVEVLEGAISRRLLEQSLKQRNITVTQQDIDDEIARAALAMGQKTNDGQPDIQAWTEMVTKEHGVPYEVYLRDSVWPSVALKKLAGDVVITEEDLQKGFEANYGKRARCRAIVMTNQRKAQEVWELARQNPTVDHFGKLAEEYSVEPSSKALQGKVPPIQRYGGQPLVEKEVFSLKPGELSSIVQLGDKYLIFFCEGFTKPTQVSFDEVRDDIFNDIHEKKQRLAMAEQFSRLKEASQIDNFLAGKTQSPAKPASHSEAPRTGSAAGKAGKATSR